MPETPAGNDQLTMVALFGHPGHELLIGQILSDASATVLWITDGSGGGPSGRNEFTASFLQDAGCRAGSLRGPFQDRAIYAAMMSGNVSLLDPVVESLTTTLSDVKPAILITDPIEYFNPVHDLANLIADISLAKSGVAASKRIYANEYPELFAHGDACMERMLTKFEMAEKRRRLENYLPLFSEWKRLEHAGKLSDMGCERIYPDPLRFNQIPAASETRFKTVFYEDYGRNAVARGLYKECLTYDSHARPFAEALVDRHLGAKR